MIPRQQPFQRRPSAAAEKGRWPGLSSSIPMERELTSRTAPQAPAPACQARIASSTSRHGAAPPVDQRSGRRPPLPGSQSRSSAAPAPVMPGVVQHHEVGPGAVAARSAIRRRVGRTACSAAAAARNGRGVPAAGIAVAVGIEAQPVALRAAAAEEFALRQIGRGEARAGARRVAGTEQPAAASRAAGPPGAWWSSAYCTILGPDVPSAAAAARCGCDRPGSAARWRGEPLGIRLDALAGRDGGEVLLVGNAAIARRGGDGRSSGPGRVQPRLRFPVAGRLLEGIVDERVGTGSAGAGRRWPRARRVRLPWAVPRAQILGEIARPSSDRDVSPAGAPPDQSPPRPRRCAS